MPRDFYEATLGVPDAVTKAYIVYSGIRVRVYARGTTDLVTVYQRETGITEGPSPESGATGGPNPFFTSASGSVQFWCDAPGRYDIEISDTIVPARIGTRIIPWNAIALDGVPEASLAQAVLDAFIPIGGELPYAGDSDPPGGRFLLAEGRLVLIADYPTAFARWGHKYNRDGSNNIVDPGGGQFRIPDKRGKVSVGADNMGTARGAAGLLPSLASTFRAIGSHVGVDQVTLSAAQLPAHTHPDNISYAAAGTHSHGGATGSMNRSNPHAHSIADPAHYHNVGGGIPVYNTGDASAGSAPITAGSLITTIYRATFYADANYTGVGIYNTDINHEHAIGSDGSHSHTKSGGVQASTGGDGAHTNLPPGEVDNWIVRMK
jgi:microcystin-dependent protein